LGFAGERLPVRPGVRSISILATMTEAYSVDIDQCAHCGLVLGEDQFLLLYCGECGFEYCSEHAGVERHDCSTICAESGSAEEAEPALSE
jgi:predicted nucleic acid binding AN1-type Zn finger protein